MKNIMEAYTRFEQGPIRPPSESESLLLRVTRNCPWNQCTFCTLFKGEKFSIRTEKELLKEIEGLNKAVKLIMDNKSTACSSMDPSIIRSASNWVRNGMKSVFLQDANTLIAKQEVLITIIRALKTNFPEIERITSYARSHTIIHKSDEEMLQLYESGLNRIHIGMESGSDIVLKKTKKGADKATHIAAGIKVKNAGIELSEYIMPGLGGIENSENHALETADALNQINPDYIRIRTLSLPNHSDLATEYRVGDFMRCGDIMIIEELLLLFKNLGDINSSIFSDHIYNLLPEIEGIWPRDREHILGIITSFLNLDHKEQMIFIIGRRLGVMEKISDLNNLGRRKIAQEFIEANHVTIETVEDIAAELMKSYI